MAKIERARATIARLQQAQEGMAKTIGDERASSDTEYDRRIRHEAYLRTFDTLLRLYPQGSPTYVAHMARDAAEDAVREAALPKSRSS